MSDKDFPINQPTRLILLRAAQAQTRLSDFIASVLDHRLNEDESDALLAEIVEAIEGMRRAIRGQVVDGDVGCGVTSYSGLAAPPGE